MTAFVFTNTTNQHATLHYRVASHAERLYSLIVPFKGGSTELDLSTFHLETGEAAKIAAQLDVQARAMGLSYKEK